MDAPTQTPPPGYRDVSVPIESIYRNKAVILGAIVLAAAPILAHAALAGGLDAFFSRAYGDNILLFLIWLLLLIVAHEAVHGFGWMTAGGVGPRHIRFGIDRKTFSPYCHLTTPIRAAAYRYGAALPLVVTGILPLTAGLLTDTPVLTMLSAIMISAAVGDLFVLWVIREVPGNALVIDHPTQAGCYVKEA
jgi:hypothetical protein